MLRTSFWVLTAGLLVGAATLLAQESVLSQFYGQGVHKYFMRDYARAFEDFNTAIENGSDDPRCYYFRGLTYLQLGREDEARADFAKGAELEMKSVTKFFNVSRALERIQGRQRLMIEEYRAQARLGVMRELEQQRRARYEELRREEARVLDRSAPPVGIPEVSPPAGAPGPVAPPPAAGQGAPVTSAPPSPAPAPAPAQAENPFSTEPAPPTPAPTQPAQPMPSEPAAPPAPPQPAPPQPEENPFAT